MKNSILAHAWAHQLRPQDHASNFYFIGSTIYSYGPHFPIAIISGHYVFMTLQNYSNTTARHKHLALSAVSHKDVIYVQFVPTTLDLQEERHFVKQNLDFWINELNTCIEQVSRQARKTTLHNQIKRLTDLITNFLIAVQLPADLSLLNLLEHPTLINSARYVSEQVKIRKQQEHKQAQKRQQLFRTQLKKWKEGKLVNLPPHSDPNLTFLRLDQQRHMIETSKGIQVTVNIAHRFYNYIQQVLPEGCQGCDYNILKYPVQQISNEYVIVGCHKIPMSEVMSIARQMEW